MCPHRSFPFTSPGIALDLVQLNYSVNFPLLYSHNLIVMEKCMWERGKQAGLNWWPVLKIIILWRLCDDDKTPSRQCLVLMFKALVYWLQMIIWHLPEREPNIAVAFTLFFFFFFSLLCVLCSVFSSCPMEYCASLQIFGRIGTVPNLKIMLAQLTASTICF